MRASVKALSIGALAATSLFVAPAAFAETSTATATVNGGSLAVSATNLSLPAVTSSHAAKVVTGQLTVTADDTTGTGDGWNVTQQVSNFVYSGVNAGTDIGAANFSITSVEAITMTAGEVVHTTGSDASPTGPQSANITSGVAGTLDTARKIMVAGATYGEGTYTQPVNVSMTVPADSRAGTYTGTLTTTMATGTGTI